MNKADLLKKSEKHQEALERELNELAVEGKKFARTSAYVAGGLLAGYLVIRLLTRNKNSTGQAMISEKYSQPKPAKASIFSGIGRVILTELAMAGIQVAKSRFNDILKNEETDNETE